MTQQTDRAAASRVLSGGFWIVLSQSFVFILVFVAQRMILSTLTKEENGTLFFERRLTDLLLGVLVDFGLNGVVLRRVAQEPGRAREILSSVVAFRLAMWVIAAAIAASAAAFSGYSALDVIIWSTYVLIAARTTLLRYTFETPYRVHGGFRLVAAVTALDAVMFLFVTSLLRNILSPTVVICAYAVSAVPGFVLLVLRDRGRTFAASAVRVKEIRSVVTEALPVIVAIGLIMLHGSIDTFILEVVGTPKDVGVLGAITASVAPFLTVVPQAVVLAAMPEIARTVRKHMYGGSENMIRDLLRFVVVIGTLTAAVSAPLMEQFVLVVSGGRYLQEWTQFYWYVWTAPFLGIFIVFQELTVTLQRRRVLTTVAIVLLSVTVVTAAALVPQYLSAGAVYARLGTLAVASVCCFLAVRHMVADAIDLLFMIRSYILIGVACATSVVLLSETSALVASAVTCVVALVTAVLTQLLRPTDFHRVLQLAGKGRSTHE